MPIAKPRPANRDPRLSKIGANWHWNDEIVPMPIPVNSEVSFAIAATFRAENRGTVDLGILANWWKKQQGLVALGYDEHPSEP